MKNIFHFDNLTAIEVTFCGLLNASARLSFKLHENSESMYFSLHLPEENNEDQGAFPKLLTYPAAEPALKSPDR